MDFPVVKWVGLRTKAFDRRGIRPERKKKRGDGMWIA